MPEAVETHGLLQSSNIIENIIKNCPNIKYDFSLYLPNNNKVIPFKYSLNNETIIRIPYQWEDDFFFDLFDKEKTFLYKSSFYQIFNFHPVHVFLNSKNYSEYNKIKKKIK